MTAAYYLSFLYVCIRPQVIYVHILIGWYFIFIKPLCDNHSQLGVASCCRTLSAQQSYFPCFLLRKASVVYTRLYSAIIEVLLYTVEPHIPCNDVFSKCWIIESNPVGA